MANYFILSKVDAVTWIGQYSDIKVYLYFVIISLLGSKINFLTLLVKSKAPENVLPITTSCWTNVGPRDVILTGDSVDRLVLYGQVTQGISPVIDAELKAFVSSDGAAFEVTLRDDGIAPDSIKSDGICK